MRGDISPRPAAADRQDSALPSPEVCRLHMVLSSVLCFLLIVVAWMLLGEVLGMQQDGDRVRLASVLATLGALGTFPVLGLLVRAVITTPLSLRMTRMRHTLMACAVETTLFLVTSVCHFFLEI